MNAPDYHQHEEYKNRLEKLREIRSLGIDPYPHTFHPTTTADALNQRFEGQEVGHFEDAEAGKTPSAVLAGRLILFRAMGKNAFGHIQDQTGRLQLLFNRDSTVVTGLDSSSEVTAMKFIEKKLDFGDILGVEGFLFRTQKGELTLFVKKLTLLCKSLLPLPDKHSGLTDKGVRYRKRWLDLIANPDSMHTLLLRSKIVHLVRSYLQEKGFIEVETPVLQNVYGGAQARPFTTHLNALQQEMFLRISLEIPLKKLIVGGLTKVFEMSKVFRNEGIDRTHNPEFTELEAYAAYWDYNDSMKLMEELFESIALHLFQTTRIQVQKEGQLYDIDLKAPWKRLSMKESIKVYAEIDVDQKSDEELRTLLRKKSKLTEKELITAPRGMLIAHLFAELVEHHLIQPHHIIDHPIETTPLCKLHRDAKLAREGIVERFESFILGGEFSNSYTELNDPILQRQLLEDQAAQKQAGNEEANPLDEEFIESICQGMPPCSGIGMGIDRLVMLFANAASIRDVLYFPLMKHEEWQI